MPPLNYPRVYALKKDRPQLTIILNGGVTTVDACRTHLEHVDGVMIGRQAYQQPWFLAELERELPGGSGSALERRDVVAAMLPYIEREIATGALLKHITRHMLGLYAGQPGARAWRRYLSEMRTFRAQASTCCTGAERTAVRRVDRQRRRRPLQPRWQSVLVSTQAGRYNFRFR